jgi:hypothetical protein
MPLFAFCPPFKAGDRPAGPDDGFSHFIIQRENMSNSLIDQAGKTARALGIELDFVGGWLGKKMKRMDGK